MARHLLVTNDFPPKIGGIQNYLWELWRRLPPNDIAVLTTPYANATNFDAEANFRIERTKTPWLLPSRWLRQHVERLAASHRADLVLFDPAVPVGRLGGYINRPYGVILHGAEVVIPGRLPVGQAVLAKVLRQASLVIAAGSYPLTEAERAVGSKLPSVVVPPGVDTDRFRPLTEPNRQRLRSKYGVAARSLMLATVNRLVPRKGMHTLISAVTELHARRPDLKLQLFVAGQGREFRRLQQLVESQASPVQLLGRIDDTEVPELYAAADLMAMMCNARWFGLEQEGFGISFLEAAACGVPQISGRSGGSHEAVVDCETGFVIQDPRNVTELAVRIEQLADDPNLRAEMGQNARQRAVNDFAYDKLALQLQAAIKETVSASNNLTH